MHILRMTNMFKKNIAYLKLCDSSITDLSRRGGVFTSIETFHFVIQLSNKIYL